MALITCPSCGKAVSDEAKKCVHCGAELKSDSDDSRKDEEEDVLQPVPTAGDCYTTLPRKRAHIAAAQL